MNFKDIKVGMLVSIKDDDLPENTIYKVRAKVEYATSCSVGVYFNNPITGCDDFKFANIDRITPVG